MRYIKTTIVSASPDALKALLLAALTLVSGCAERETDDSSAPYDPAKEERTQEDILEDLCQRLFECSTTRPYPNFGSCIDHYYPLVTDPVLWPRECGSLLLDIYACVTAADSCEDFIARRQRDTDLHCEALRVESDELKCMLRD
jgi:hypothetical protein